MFGLSEGRLWIHAASKVPDEETIKAMEDFYREIYAINGVTDLKFPDHYPVSRLLGSTQNRRCKIFGLSNHELLYKASIVFRIRENN